MHLLRSDDLRRLAARLLDLVPIRRRILRSSRCSTAAGPGQSVGPAGTRQPPPLSTSTMAIAHPEGAP